MDWKYNATKLTTKMQMAVAWKLPNWLVMWCAVRLMANATQGKHSHQIVGDLTALDALKRWPE